MVLLALLILTGACKADDPGPRDPAIAAGDVREVTGTVTATRDQASRALGVGDVVASGDRIVTGPDGEVVIELRHNHVRWRLGPDQAKTPMEAAAWSAPPPTAAEISGDRSAVAGRHAEREAADTAAATATMTTTEPTADDKPRKTAKKTGDAKRNAPQPGDDEDIVQPFSDHGEVGTGGGDKVAPPMEPTLPESIDRDLITAAMEPVKPKLVACGEGFPDAPSAVKIKVKVSASGSVSSVNVIDEVDAGLASCLEAAIKKVKFAATAKGGNFTYPASVR